MARLRPEGHQLDDDESDASGASGRQGGDSEAYSEQQSDSEVDLDEAPGARTGNQGFNRVLD